MDILLQINNKMLLKIIKKLVKMINIQCLIKNYVKE